MKLLGAEVVPRRLRQPHAEGRDERGAARLGHQCRRHLLHHRHGRRPAPLSVLVRDFQSVDRQRDARTDHAGRRPHAGHAGGRGRRGSNAIGLFHPFLDMPISPSCVEAAGHGLETGKAWRVADGGRRACCTATAPICCRPRTPDRGGAFDLRRPRLSRHRAGTRLGCTMSAG